MWAGWGRHVVIGLKSGVAGRQPSKDPGAQKKEPAISLEKQHKEVITKITGPHTQGEA